jgi:hypothetical protein
LRATRHRALLLALAVLTAPLAACGDDGSTDTSEDSAGTAEPDGTGEGVLADVCPDPIVLQMDWFPSAEHGPYFQLIGDGGTVDVDTGSYRGPIGDTGVDLEIRSGGPFLGQQTVTSLMYQDDSITIGFVHTDDAVRFSEELPTVSVVATLEHSPLAWVWDPEVHDFDSFEDVADSGATILVFTKEVNYVPFLIAEGIVPETQFDDSFDGSYSRFAADNALIQQAFVTETMWRLEHEVPEFGRPTDFLLIKDAGYDPYLSSISVRTDRFEELSPCMEQLVPMIQQSTVDYVSDPAATNEVMARMVEDMDTFWTLPTDLLAHSVDMMTEYEIVSNGPDDTLGNFDMERVQTIIDDFHSTFGEVDSADPDVTPEQIVVNDFVDPSIGL